MIGVVEALGISMVPFLKYSNDLSSYFSENTYYVVYLLMRPPLHILTGIGILLIPLSLQKSGTLIYEVPSMSNNNLKVKRSILQRTIGYILAGCSMCLMSFLSMGLVWGIYTQYIQFAKDLYKCLLIILLFFGDYLSKNKRGNGERRTLIINNEVEEHLSNESPIIPMGNMYFKDYITTLLPICVTIIIISVMELVHQIQFLSYIYYTYLNSFITSDPHWIGVCTNYSIATITASFLIFYSRGPQIDKLVRHLNIWIPLLMCVLLTLLSFNLGVIGYVGYNERYSRVEFGLVYSFIIYAGQIAALVFAFFRVKHTSILYIYIYIFIYIYIYIT